MEPDWVKQIPSTTVCDWFYVFFWIYAVLAVLSVLAAFALISSKMPLGMKLGMGFGNLLALAIMAVHFLFVYVVCDRSLLAKKEGFAAMQVMAQKKGVVMPKKR